MKQKEIYGLIDPEGHFYEVAWSEHVNFAFDFIVDHEGYEEYFQQLHSSILVPSKALDFLIFDLGWIMIHDPSRSLDLKDLIIEKGSQVITKNQKEAVFDWYMDIDVEIAAMLYDQL